MTAPTRNILNTNRSGTDDEQIHSLSSRISEVSNSEKFWHDAYLWFIGAAILVSIALFFVQHHEASLTKERADAESELNLVKDRKLSREISSADERAGKANERAAVLEAETAQARTLIASAQADAARATEKAALAESHLAESQRETAIVRKESAEASAKAEGFRLDIARANERAAQADLARKQLELQLAEMFADRTITPSQVNRIVSLLRPFAGQTADITVFGETNEITQFSTLIFDCFAKGGWLLNITRPSGGGNAAKGLLVGLRPNSDPALTVAVNSIIDILRESLKNGVGPWDFDKLANLAGGGMAMVSQAAPVGTPPEQKPTPTGTSPLRIVIGSK